MFSKAKLIIVLFVSFLYSEFIPIEKAQLVAKNAIIKNNLYSQDFSIESVYILEEDSVPLIYAINIKEKG